MEYTGKAYRIGMKSDGGGFVGLSDFPIRDLYTSSFYRGVVFLPTSEEDYYVFNRGADAPRTVRWRSRVEVADVPMAVISVRVLADVYPVIFRIYEGDATTPVLELDLTSDKVRKLPVLRRGREWSFEVEALGTVATLEVGTSGRVR